MLDWFVGASVTSMSVITWMPVSRGCRLSHGCARSHEAGMPPPSIKSGTGLLLVLLLLWDKAVLPLGPLDLTRKTITQRLQNVLHCGSVYMRWMFSRHHPFP